MVIDLTAARKGVEALYNCRCSIENVVNVKNAETGITTQIWQMVADDVPCKKSIKNIAASNEDGSAAAASQEIKLFLAPEINVKAGSRITITDGLNKTERFKSAGRTAIFTNHQEIVLELAEKWA